MLAATYARYSTDNQRRTSIEDQQRGNRERAVALGADVGFEHADDETSGAVPIESRSGSAALMRDAAAGRFQVLIVEALDRFSRDVVDQERAVRRLEFSGIRIIGRADGYDSANEGRELMRVVRGGMNAQLLIDIARKVHRGLTGQLLRGYHAGGISYGYRSEVAGVDGHGEPIGHRLVVQEEEAARVRWIFERYAEGWSCQRIGATLNRDRVPSPRGSAWAVSALYGCPNKGSGVLNNEIYIGRLIWNRSQWIKDPDTGRRRRRDRPRTEWHVSERPELAVVPLELWNRVRKRMDTPRLAGGGNGKGAIPRTLFGGLLRCGICGGAVIAVSKTRYGCAARKDRGATVCTGILVPRQQLETRLVAMIRDDLLSAEAMAELQKQVELLLEARRRDLDRTTAASRGRLAQLGREIERLVEAVANFGPSEALRTRLAASEAERASLQAEQPIAQRSAPAGLMAGYKRLIANLQGALGRDIPRARGILRELLGEIRLEPQSGEIYAVIEARAERLLSAGGASLGLVAGTRFVSQKRVRVR
jgi:site-specific DNA recombinase